MEQPLSADLNRAAIGTGSSVHAVRGPQVRHGRGATGPEKLDDSVSCTLISGTRPRTGPGGGDGGLFCVSVPFVEVCFPSESRFSFLNITKHFYSIVFAPCKTREMIVMVESFYEFEPADTEQVRLSHANPLIALAPDELWR